MFQQYSLTKQYIQLRQQPDPDLEDLVRRPPADSSAEQYQRILDKRKAEITRMKRLKAHIENVTDLLDPRYRDVLYYRFICGYTKIKTARLMHYSESYVMKLEKDAIEAVDKLEERSIFVRLRNTEKDTKK